VLLGYIVLTVAIGIACTSSRRRWRRLLVGFLIALLFGLEAASLRRWTFARRGWVNPAWSPVPTRKPAERRFFDVWVVDGGTGFTLPIPPPPSAPRTGERRPDVIGLFPEPGARA